VNFRRSFTVTKRILRDLRNDKRTIGLIVLAPVFAMFVFGLAFSGEVSDLRLIVVNSDEGAILPPATDTVSLSDDIISNLDREVLDLEFMTDDEEALEKVESGNAYAVLIFPKDFTRDVIQKLQNESYSGNTTIELRVDKSNINVANAVTKSVNEALIETIEEAGGEAPISLDSENAVYGNNADFMDFFVPGIIAFVVYLLTTLLTLISFVGERSSGTLDRILATPLSEGEIVVGYAIAFGMLGMLQAALLLTVGILVFNITIVGNVVLAFVVIALLAVVCQALGILLSSLAKREAQAVQFIPFVVLPAFLLAGVFWPVEAIPSWLRPASFLVPPTYAAEAGRSIMLRGWGLDMVWPEIVALIIFAAIFLTIAILSLKRRK
jgi:ABC-2 type transport system permease protein